MKYKVLLFTLLCCWTTVIKTYLVRNGFIKAYGIGRNGQIISARQLDAMRNSSMGSISSLASSSINNRNLSLTEARANLANSTLALDHTSPGYIPANSKPNGQFGSRIELKPLIVANEDIDGGARVGAIEARNNSLESTSSIKSIDKIEAIRLTPPDQSPILHRSNSTSNVSSSPSNVVDAIEDVIIKHKISKKGAILLIGGIVSTILFIFSATEVGLDISDKIG